MATECVGASGVTAGHQEPSVTHTHTHSAPLTIEVFDL